MRWIRLTSQADPERVRAALRGLGVWSQAVEGGGERALAVEAHSAAVPLGALEAIEGVAAVLTAACPHPLLDRQAGLTIEAGPVRIGGEAPPVLIAGPCAAESRDQVEEAAAQAAAAGARALRGGAFKPRTSPHCFQGHGLRALEWLRAAADAHGLALVSEVLSERDAAAAAELCDVIQVGSRSMQAYGLLRAIGEAGRPALLKRGAAATVEEWLLAGEHLLAAGAAGVVFCERGVRGYDPQTRGLLDLGAAALVRWVHRQPIVVDPSHAAGRRDLILPLGKAALAAGAHGLLIEAHPDPAAARSDGPQALTPTLLAGLGRELGFAPRLTEVGA